MNTDLMFSSKTDLWETPQDFFDLISREFSFTLDVCAVSENTKCKEFYSPEQNGLSQKWEGTCWMNPPYGRIINKWVKKAYESYMGGLLLLHFFQQEQIQNGFMITFMGKQK